MLATNLQLSLSRSTLNIFSFDPPYFFQFSAGPGTYVFEPPGETHTLLVNEDCEEMVTMFHVTGSLLYTNDQNEVIGFDDVFSKVSLSHSVVIIVGL